MRKYDTVLDTKEERATDKATLRPPDYSEVLYPQEEDLDKICDCNKCEWCLSSKMQKVAPGIKEDGGKLRLDLIDPIFQEFLALALGYGADKYDDHNWLKGMQWSRVYGALLRHLRSWYMGEDTDTESGNHHLAHAAAMLMFLVGYSQRPEFKKWDDRMFKDLELPF